ncbi:MAG: hypothetical protein BGO13_00210 [Burkholderiales bacterium 66-5]|nr:MAG: hypothetical protein BGO13_00210 [Burkholderiales bacterium 66-5]
MPKQATLAFVFKRTREPGGLLKKELAQALGISGSMVSRLAKRGMPTDSVARAERWRRRHLEPGRMKGQRLDTIKDFDLANRPLVFEGVDPRKVLALVGDMGWLLAAFLEAGAPGGNYWVDILRQHMRVLPGGFRPAFPVATWLELLSHVMSAADAEKLCGCDSEGGLTSEEVAFAISRAASDFEPDYWYGAACAGPVEMAPSGELPEAGPGLDTDSENFD